MTHSTPSSGAGSSQLLHHRQKTITAPQWSSLHHHRLQPRWNDWNYWTRFILSCLWSSIFSVIGIKRVKVTNKWNHYLHRESARDILNSQPLLMLSRKLDKIELSYGLFDIIHPTSLDFILQSLILHCWVRVKLHKLLTTPDYSHLPPIHKNSYYVAVSSGEWVFSID